MVIEPFVVGRPHSSDQFPDAGLMLLVRPPFLDKIESPLVTKLYDPAGMPASHAPKFLLERVFPIVGEGGLCRLLGPVFDSQLVVLDKEASALTDWAIHEDLK